MFVKLAKKNSRLRNGGCERFAKKSMENVYIYVYTFDRDRTVDDLREGTDVNHVAFRRISVVKANDFVKIDA